MIIEVELEWYEVALAVKVGCVRRVRSIQQNLRTAGDASGSDPDTWTHNIEGAIGEMAAAKGLGVYWSGSVDTFKKKLDIDNFEIRCRSKHYYELFVRPHEPQDRWYLLVRGHSANRKGLRMPPIYQLVGVMRGSAAMRPEWLKNPGKGFKPAYFVPDECLIDIENFLDGDRTPGNVHHFSQGLELTHE